MLIEFGVEWPEASIDILNINEFNPEQMYELWEGYWQFHDYEDSG